MPHPHSGQGVTAVVRPLERLEERAVPAVFVRFDYSQDAAGFFSDPSRREALERAAAPIVAQTAGDTLAAVVPSGGNSWTASFANPIRGGTTELPNLRVNQDEVIVFVGGGSLGAGELGLTTSGGYTASGTRPWLDTVVGRGQAGAASPRKTDFSTWGGMITFDADAPWHFGAAAPPAGAFDFQTVATHELMHVFGFGLGEPAFTRHIAGGVFAGPAVLAATGGAGATVVGDPPDHFAAGTAYQGQESPMAASLPQGVRRDLTPLDVAALADIGWATPGAAAVAAAPLAAAARSASSPVTAAPVEVGGDPVVAVGGATAVDVYGVDGGLVRTTSPFGPAYTGGVRVAVADVTGDGVPDIVAGTGPGLSAVVRVIDGATDRVVAEIAPFEAGFTGGVHVAAADLDGDGFAEVVVTPDQSGGPVVAVYRGAGLAAGRADQVARFWGLADAAFRGGLRPALGDVTGDGVPDLALAAGFGGGPRVTLLDGRAVLGNAAVQVAPDFFAFEPTLRNGAFVTFADVDGDGRLDLITGAGPGGGPRVTAYSGPDLLSGVRTVVADFFAGDPADRTGVRLAGADLDGDGRPDLVIGTPGAAFAYTANMAESPTVALPVSGAADADGVFVG